MQGAALFNEDNSRLLFFVANKERYLCALCSWSWPYRRPRPPLPSVLTQLRANEGW